MVKSSFFSFLVVISTVSIPMEQPNLPIVSIKTWKDVNSFAGQVIAYQTSSLWLGGSQKDDVFSLHDFKYAFVKQELMQWRNSGPGYFMARLIRSKGVGHFCALTDIELKSTTLLMRLATSAEIKRIKEAISSDEAEFEYFNKGEILLKLDNEN